MTRYSDPTTVISSGLALSDPISQVHKIRVTEPEEPEQMLTLFLPIVIR